MQRDLRAVRRTVEPPLRECGALGADLARIDVPAFGQAGGHRERRVPAERPDLEHAVRLGDPDEQLEEPTCHRAGEHRSLAELAGRRRRQFGEQWVVRRRDALGIRLDARVDDLH